MVYLTIFYDQSQGHTVFCKKCLMVFNYLTLKYFLILVMEFVSKIKLCMFKWSDMHLLFFTVLYLNIMVHF